MEPVYTQYDLNCPKCNADLGEHFQSALDKAYEQGKQSFQITVAEYLKGQESNTEYIQKLVDKAREEGRQEGIEDVAKLTPKEKKDLAEALEIPQTVNMFRGDIIQEERQRILQIIEEVRYYLATSDESKMEGWNEALNSLKEKI